MALGLAIGLSGAGSLFGGINASNAANTAAQEEQQAGQQGLGILQPLLSTEQQSAQPYTNAGSASISSLMGDLSNGTFGPGSMPAAPGFTAPTLADAQNEPGYQFSQQQGDKGILEGAGAAGGAISGGTLKSLAGYNQNLATTNYTNVFNRALQGYQANLQGYQANLANQAQAYGQLYQPAVLGQQAEQGLNVTQAATGNSIANLMGSIGSAQAGGTVGSANALNQGIAGVGGAATTGILLSKYMNTPG